MSERVQLLFMCVCVLEKTKQTHVTFLPFDRHLTPQNMLIAITMKKNVTKVRYTLIFGLFTYTQIQRIFYLG